MLRLCSASQTRAQLLNHASIAFVQSAVDFDEERIVAASPKDFVYQATVGKYHAALQAYDYAQMSLLVADTVVTSQGHILRKARCEEDARNILMMQSGNVTSIVTCMIYRSLSFELIDISSTDYQFEVFDAQDLENYLQSGLWRGKAGACMVEGFCKRYIQSVTGYESCAMGLSIEVLKAFLED